MTNTVTPQDYAAFLESLRVTENGPAEMHGLSFDAEVHEIWSADLSSDEMIEYLLERCRRADANAKPATLLEDVKACVRAGMDAEASSWAVNCIDASEAYEFRKLSEAGDK